MGAPLTPTEALRALLPAVTAEREMRVQHGSASAEHLKAVGDLSIARLRAEDALRWADQQAGLRRTG